MTATPPPEPTKWEQLKTLLRLEQQEASQGGAWIAVGHQERMNQEIVRSNRWHQRQVEAMQRARGCELEPPIDEDEPVSPTLINCNFQGDTAVAELAKALSVDDNTVVQPPAPTEPQPCRPPWWGDLFAWLARLLAFLLIASLIAWIIWITLAWFSNPGGGGDTVYEIIAEPFDPEA